MFCLSDWLCLCIFFLVITGFIIWSWLGLWAPGREQIAKKSTSKTKFNHSVESVGHGELVLFCKFFTAAREYSPIPWPSRLLVGTLGWGNLVFWPGIGEEGRGRGTLAKFQVTGMIEVCFFLGLTIFWTKLFFLAVALLKCSKYSFFQCLNFRFHGSSPSLGIRGTPPV